MPVILLTLWLLPWTIAVAEDAQVEVTREKGHYLFKVETVMEAPADKVRAVVSDYPNLHLLHDVIQESDLSENPDGHPRVHVRAHPCVLIFCKDLNMVLDMDEQREGILIGTMVPEVSDFSFGIMRWEIQPLEPQRTRLGYQADLVPAFWMPPIIGPWLLQGKISNLAVKMIENIGLLVSGRSPEIEAPQKKESVWDTDESEY